MPRMRLVCWPFESCWALCRGGFCGAGWSVLEDCAKAGAACGAESRSGSAGAGAAAVDAAIGGAAVDVGTARSAGRELPVTACCAAIGEAQATATNAARKVEIE